jgi:sugar O-acyltransferase (sialic acid O-acetyltransferase NeuD family)
MKTLGIFGTSGFAREVGDIAHVLGYRVLYIAHDMLSTDASLAQEEIIMEGDLGKYPDLQLAIGIGDNSVRQKVAVRFAGQGTFVNLIHPDTSFGKGQREAIEARQGVIVCAGVRFTNHIQVGDFTIFNLNATVGHDALVDDFVNIAPGANISGNVHLGQRCWIGTGAAINQGRGGAKLMVGADTIVGSGSVVVKDCDPGAVYAGVPAKRIK